MSKRVVEWSENAPNEMGHGCWIYWTALRSARHVQQNFTQQKDNHPIRTSRHQATVAGQILRRSIPAFHFLPNDAPQRIRQLCKIRSG